MAVTARAPLATCVLSCVLTDDGSFDTNSDIVDEMSTEQAAQLIALLARELGGVANFLLNQVTDTKSEVRLAEVIRVDA